MRISIRLWTILALNLFVLGLAGVFGWIAQDVAGQVVEERLAKEMAASVSAFLQDKSYPLNDAMMGYLREMFNADWVATEGDGDTIVASSLAPPATKELAGQMPALARGGEINLAGARYRVAWHEVKAKDSQAAARQGLVHRLYMLVPYAQFAEARTRASGRVASVVLPAAIAATLLALVLAYLLAQPIRRLAHEMDRLAERDDVAEPAEPNSRRQILDRGPKETRQLAASFYGLLDRLAAARQRLRAHERLATLGTICLSVAHELRNPLSGIKMNVRVLKDHVVGDDGGVEAILREIARMELYLNELMTLAPTGPTAGRTVTLAPARLSVLSESVLTILAGRCRHANVEIVREYPADEPEVPADANQVRQTMMNLMVNAIEAMPGGGRMTVAVSRAGGSIRLAVSDTGPGVPAGAGDIFAPFATGKANGVGLGLYLARQAVSRHGGRIGYDNNPGGATFWFELPRGAEGAGDRGSGIGDRRRVSS